jgi:hypothetical protein
MTATTAETSTPKEPVTIIVHRKIKKGMEAEAEAWLHGVSKVLERYEGALGVEVIRPANPADPKYTYIYHFADYACLNAWHESDERKAWLARSEAFMAEPPQYEELTGLEYWFTPPAGVARAPKRWRQLIVSWSALTPLSFILSLTVLPLLRELLPGQILLHTIINLGVLLWIASYVLMPQVTKRVQWFLHPKP